MPHMPVSLSRQKEPMPRILRLACAALALVLALAAPLAAQSAGQADAPALSRVFAVNLWSGPLDLKLGVDGVFQTLGLKSLAASQMVEFSSMPSRALMYRNTGSDTWQNMTEVDGRTSLYRQEAGRTYLILVHPDGKPGLYQLGFPQTDLPRMAVLNASGKTLGFVQVGTGLGQDTVAQAVNLLPGWTDFLSLPEGSYGGFWAYQDMPAGASHNYTSGSDGLSLGMYPLRKNSWYIFIIWDDAQNQGSGGIIWDISPSP